MSFFQASNSLGASPTETPARRRRIDRGVIGLAIIVAVVGLAALAPLLSPYDPDIGEGALRLAPPGTPGHWLGLDGQGRDILSRLIWGARLSLIASIVPVAIAFIVSLGLGLAAGFARRPLGAVIMRGIDVLFAFPMILFAIAIAALLGPGLTTIIATIALSLVPYMTRVVYFAVLAETGREYLDAARLLGAGRSAILFGELLPNVLSPAIIYATTLIGPMIGFSSGLSFLGLGIQPPLADWGRMTVDGVGVFAEGAPHVVIAPGVAIIIVSLAFNWLGSGLRNWLDPHHHA
ncbi:ABC transporter permease [Labrys sp. KNU-23]|uniref:ABC transporter permease n=1 Tax=Labrys sp. KNU-23 TaxID=2789216 RepID=UPI0011EF57E9|nr:ABC transporter permease [Labrys sp. KNU-23]QEN86292.1 ABC transporter permease [Labrys sp. KNU-23]